MVSRRPRRLAIGLLLVCLALVANVALSGCGSGSSSASGTTAASSGTSGAGMHIDLITSVPASDPFYAVIAQAGKQAAKDLGVTVTYRSPDTYTTTPEEQARLIDNAVASKPDGIVTTLPFDALATHVKAAVAAGIPTAVINTGAEQIARTGALAYFGEASFDEGLDMGKRLKAAGVTHVLCPGLPRGTVKALDDRCDGLAAGLKPGRMSTIVIDPGNPTAMRNRVEAAVQKDNSIDGVISLGASVSAPTIAAKHQLGARGAQIKWASFDLGAPTLRGIIDGDYLFAEDQQPFLQVYDAIVAVILNKRYDLAPGANIVSTSSAVVGKQEAQRLLALSQQEIR